MDNNSAKREQLVNDLLKIYTLGRFQVSYGGKKLFEETGRYQKIGDLLMFFITYRNKPAPPEALSHYKGHYYPECPECQWIISKRHHYRSLFVRSANELFAIQKEYHFFSQMAADCEKVLSIEDFDESIHLYYMEALLEEGKIAQARKHYEFITALNYNELGAKPSPAMQRIYKTIKVHADKEIREIDDFQKFLTDDDCPQKALVFEPNTFRLLCRLEKSRAERTGRPIHLGLITLTGKDTRQVINPSFKQQGEKLIAVMQSTLRKVDVISLINYDQFAILLPGLDYKQAETVLKRIETAYYNSDNSPGEVLLLSTVHPVLPE